MALVPPAVVTVTSTVWPAATGGAVATICVSVLEVTVAALVPKFTAVADARAVPVIVTEFWPVSGPLLGATPVTAGAVEAPAVVTAAGASAETAITPTKKARIVVITSPGC